MSARLVILWTALAALASGCASTGGVEPTTEPSVASLADWSNVARLRIGTPIRVTERAGDKSYGRVMTVTNLTLTLELVDGSKAIARGDVALIERFPASLPKSVPGAAVGLGAALSLSSSSAPDTYRRSVATGHEALDKGNIPITNGYYVDALGLVGRSVERVHRAIESTRTTVVVYRR